MDESVCYDKTDFTQKFRILSWKRNFFRFLLQRNFDICVQKTIYMHRESPLPQRLLHFWNLQAFLIFCFHYTVPKYHCIFDHALLDKWLFPDSPVYITDLIGKTYKKWHLLRYYDFQLPPFHYSHQIH